MRRALLALALSFTLGASPARPDGPPGLSVDVPATAGVAGGALAAWGLSELFQDRLTPPSCRWCEPPALDRHAREELAWSDPHAAAVLSDVLVVAVPASLAGADYLLAGRDARRAGEDVLVAVEAVGLAGLGTQIVKLAAARRRPYAWSRGARTGAEDDLSFWSGHSSMTFAAATAFGTVAKLRGYDGWPAVYAVGLTAAAGVAYLRTAADKHWLTDVAAGAAFGAGVGVAVPLLLHRGSADARTTLAPLPLGVKGIAISGVF